MPDLTGDLARSIDAVLGSLFGAPVGIDIKAWSDLAREPICLLI